jgi:hypothetical protein
VRLRQGPSLTYFESQRLERFRIFFTKLQLSSLPHNFKKISVFPTHAGLLLKAHKPNQPNKNKEDWYSDEEYLNFVVKNEFFFTSSKCDYFFSKLSKTHTWFFCFFFQ